MGWWWGCLYAYATVYVWRSEAVRDWPGPRQETFFLKLVLSFHVGSRDWTWVIRLMYPLSNLADPHVSVFFNEWINSSLTVMFVCLHLKVDFSIFSLSPLFPFIFFLFFCTPPHFLLLPFWWVSHILFWSPTGYVVKDDFEYLILHALPP